MNSDEPGQNLTVAGWGRYLFLTSRPYSYASELSRGLMFYLAAGGGPRAAPLTLAAVQTLLMWVYFNWKSDSIQRDPGRRRVPWLLVALAAGLALAVGWFANGVVGAAGPLLYMAAIWLYAQKAGRPWLGPLGPLLRGVTVMAQAVMVSMLLADYPPGGYWAIAMAFSLWHVGRNLTGDVRDMRTDRYELPARFGIAVTVWVLRGCILSGVLVALLALPIPVFGAIVIVMMMWCVAEILRVCYPAAEAYKWGYVTHQLGVFWSLLVQLFIAWRLGLPLIWFLVLVAMLPLHVFYWWLPGKRYPGWEELRPRRVSQEEHSKILV